MELGLEQMLQLLHEVEEGDPMDWGDLPLDEDSLRRLVMIDLLQRDRILQGVLSPEECQLIYLLAAARLVLENMVLHMRLLQLVHPDESAEQQMRILLKRFRNE